MAPTDHDLIDKLTAWREADPRRAAEYVRFLQARGIRRGLLALMLTGREDEAAGEALCRDAARFLGADPDAPVVLLPEPVLAPGSLDLSPTILAQLREFGGDLDKQVQAFCSEEGRRRLIDQGIDTEWLDQYAAGIRSQKAKHDAFMQLVRLPCETEGA